jgi:hypothetical protein
MQDIRLLILFKSLPQDFEPIEVPVKTNIPGEKIYLSQFYIPSLKLKCTELKSLTRYVSLDDFIEVDVPKLIDIYIDHFSL